MPASYPDWFDYYIKYGGNYTSELLRKLFVEKFLGNYSVDLFGSYRGFFPYGDFGVEDLSWVMAAFNTFKYGFPVILIVGIVGNGLSMVTLCSRHFRDAPCAVMLFALAVVDILILGLGMIGWTVLIIMLPGFGEDITPTPRGYFCFLVVAEYIVNAMSPWTVVLITFERFVSVTWPFRAATICSKRKMVISWFAVFFIISLIFSCFYYFDSDAFCGSDVFAAFRMNWIVFVVMCAGPFILIVAGNAGIIHQTYVAHRNRRRTVGSSSSAAASAAADARSITVMLVVVCAVFLVTVYPYYVLAFVYTYYGDTYNFRLLMMVFISAILYRLSTATNFILYFTTGRLFRKAFLQVMCRCKHQASPRHNVQRGLQRRNSFGETRV